ncbi:VOC family protein [Rathayibacter sp. YIM 133350]|uniref:VOC family protein n=1 Tax=Rathayibacter sp. YIM 133350 TaxID=3131992 RepID=UPI00307E65A3
MRRPCTDGRGRPVAGSEHDPRLRPADDVRARGAGESARGAGNREVPGWETSDTDVTGRTGEVTVETTIGSVVWGSRDVSRAIAFWCAALDYEPREEPSRDWAVLVPRSGAGVQLAIMEVHTAPEGRRRHHIDLYSDDQQKEVARLLALGASRVDWRYEEDADYVVLTDPDGNMFDVVQRPR